MIVYLDSSAIVKRSPSLIASSTAPLEPPDLPSLNTLALNRFLVYLGKRD
ncbi:MAG: hypothetical protein QW291_00690 [Thermofilaceae archaeon]